MGLIRNREQEETWLIVGLGNPGRQYEQTWHNAGFMALEILSQRHKIALDRIKFKGLFGRGRIAKTTVILLKPSTFMNRSGESVQEAAAYFKVPPDRILVIYDDLDIATGLVRMREKGSAGTHNGMRSIVQSLSATEFPRIRVGIGPIPAEWDLVRYVLSEIPEDRRELLWDGLNRAADAVEIALKSGISLAMNRCNKRKSKNNEELETESGIDVTSSTEQDQLIQ